MASLPDGIVVSMKSVDRGMGVEFKVTGDLIKCKNCAFHFMFHDRTVNTTYDFCDEYDVKTNPEGYCWKAVRKDVLDG